MQLWPNTSPFLLVCSHDQGVVTVVIYIALYTYMGTKAYIAELLAKWSLVYQVPSHYIAIPSVV